MEWSWSDWESLKATRETQGDIRASPRTLIPTQGPCNTMLHPNLLPSPHIHIPLGPYPGKLIPAPCACIPETPPTQPALFHHCVPALISKCWTDARGMCVSWVSPCTGYVSHGVKSSWNIPMP